MPRRVHREKPEKAFDAIPGIQSVHEVWSVIAPFFSWLDSAAFCSSLKSAS